MKAYQIDNTNIATEIFDNEAVLINIPQGKYYNVRGNTGIRTLEMLREPVSFESILIAIRNEFESDNETDLVTELGDFINQLANENIVIPATVVVSSEIEKTDLKYPYEKAELEIFDDMQELIMLDPVHDVESFKGWPQKNEELANG